MNLEARQIAFGVIKSIGVHGNIHSFVSVNQQLIDGVLERLRQRIYKQRTHARSCSQLAACACAIQLNWKRNYLPFFSYIRARASCATRLHNLRQTALLLFCVFISCVLFT